MALGIDAEVHRGTLDAQGQTIAVLGNGLADSQIYPRAHFQLMQSLLQSGGSVLSELWPNVPASTGTFPARNRIISGLSMATVIIEASEKVGHSLPLDLLSNKTEKSLLFRDLFF